MPLSYLIKFNHSCQQFLNAILVMVHIKLLLKTAKVIFTIRIPLKEKITLVEEAKRRKITVTKLIRKVIQNELKIQKDILIDLHQDLCIFKYNVLVSAIDYHKKKNHKKAIKLIERIKNSEYQAFIST